MATLTEDDVLEQLDAQDNLFSFMKTAHSILLQGIRQFLPSLFVDNDEEIVEYAGSLLYYTFGPRRRSVMSASAPHSPSVGYRSPTRRPSRP